jgi:hypothetical protein
MDLCRISVAGLSGYVYPSDSAREGPHALAAVFCRSAPSCIEKSSSRDPLVSTSRSIPYTRPSIHPCMHRDTSTPFPSHVQRLGVGPFIPLPCPWHPSSNGTSGVVATKSASNAEGRQFDPGLVFSRPSMNGPGLPTRGTLCKMIANLSESNEIRTCTRYKMDAKASKSTEILRGAPCKMDADPSKLNEIAMVLMGYIFANDRYHENVYDPKIYSLLHGRESGEIIMGYPLPNRRE